MATEQTIYAYAHVESWLEQYAKQSRLNAAELIADVAGRLLKPNGVQDVNGVQARKPNGVQARGNFGDGARKASFMSSYWSKLTKEQRSKEMKRRQKVAADRRAKGLRHGHPAGGVA